MHRPLLLLTLGLLLAGCASPAPNLPTATPIAPTSAEESAPDQLVLQDCFSLRAFLPVDYADAQRRLPADLTAASWVMDSDRTLAMLEANYVECGQGTANGQPTGPARLLLLEIPLESQDALSGENVFPLLAVEDNAVVEGFWSRLVPTEDGTLSRADTQAPTVLQANAGPLSATLTAATNAATTGLGNARFVQLLGPPDARLRVDVELTSVSASLGGTSVLAALNAPAAMVPGTPAIVSAGFATSNGPLQKVTFTVQRADAIES